MLFRLQLQASSEGGDRRNDNKSYTIQDPSEAENCPKSRCARVQTNICCNYFDYFWPMQAAIEETSLAAPPAANPATLISDRGGYASKKRSIPDFCNEFHPKSPFLLCNQCYN